mgnify:CR=1 FL=1
MGRGRKAREPGAETDPYRQSAASLTASREYRRDVSGVAAALSHVAFNWTAFHRALDRTRPIAVGPWLGEVGFELLYWVPFLRWAATHVGFDRERLLIIARGGTTTWY